MTIRFLLSLVLCVVALSAFAQTNTAEVDVPVPVHDIARGTVLSEGVLVYAAVSERRANASIVRSLAALSGMETRRALRAGEMIRTIDVKRPTMVAKGSTVTMLFEADGLSLTSVGRALAEGAAGDVITVLNPASFRQVQAQVIAPGTVRVGMAR